MKRDEPGTLWGGRFQSPMDPELMAFNRSLRIDARLLDADARASQAHARALERIGVLSREECQCLFQALEDIRRSAEESQVCAAPFEDVHSYLEAALTERAGDAGRKIHAGRSRNDQVATALRLWMREEVDRLCEAVRAVQCAMLDHAEASGETAMPGYTHLQRAQPILWAHWGLAYVEMLERDGARLADARRRINTLPLGAGALAGTAYPIDREAVAKELGFEAVAANSLDAVADRDFCVEFAAACAMILMHLSRCAEDLILFSSAEFGFLSIADRAATGSSLLPQKKNPDVLELIRGKSGRVFGRLTALLVMQKGLSLAYNKDLQEDKEAVFDCADTTRTCLRAMALIIPAVQLDRERMRQAAEGGYQNATELADYLVRRGVPFREAHDVTGKIVLDAMADGLELVDMPLERMQARCSAIAADVADVLVLERTLATKSAIGGTAPERVREALTAARARLNGVR